MTYSLAIVIMAHPARRARAELLAEEVKADTIIWDDDRKGEWDTGARAWRTGSLLSASHVLVLQDDAIPVANLRGEIHARIHQHPTMPISLYLGKKKPSRWARAVNDAVCDARSHEAGWILATHLLHGVGIVLPVGMIPSTLRWAHADSRPYDQRIGAYLRTIGKPTLYTWPSLVDHDDSFPTLVEHGDDKRLSTSGRVAYRVGPGNGSPVTIVVNTPWGAEK